MKHLWQWVNGYGISNIKLLWVLFFSHHSFLDMENSSCFRNKPAILSPKNFLMKSDMYSTFFFHLIMWQGHTFSYIKLSEEPVHVIKNELKQQIHKKKCWQYHSMPFNSGRDCWRLACFIRSNVGWRYVLSIAQESQ